MLVVFHSTIVKSLSHQDRCIWIIAFLIFLLHIVLLQHKIVPAVSSSSHAMQKSFKVKLADLTTLPRPISERVKEESALEKKQIVQTTESSELLPLKDTKYLSDKTVAVSRETRAPIIDKFSEGRTQSSPVKREQEVEESKIKNFDLSFAKGVKPKMQEMQKKMAGTNNMPLNPTKAASSNDYLEDLPLGEMVQLNAKEYKYYSFYNRIRERLEQYWGESIQAKSSMLMRSGRRLPAGVDNITSLFVIMDHAGNIVRVHVKSGSGVSELDDAAVESFNKAGPFPNPPKELLQSGYAEIEWGFVVKT